MRERYKSSGCFVDPAILFGDSRPRNTFFIFLFLIFMFGFISISISIFLFILWDDAVLKGWQLFTSRWGFEVA